MEPDSRAATGAHRPRPVNQPIPIQVLADAEQPEASQRPRAIILGGRRQVVRAVQETWRLDDEWWRSRPIQRMYYRVELEEGRTMTLYHDLLDGTWWLQRY